MFPTQHGASLEDFVVRECRRRDVHMDMRNVVGQTDHYAGQTWRDAALEPQYRPGKMRDVFAQFERNPGYYFNDELDNGIMLGSIDGTHWYTDGSGNHRTVVARFACDRIARLTGQYPLVRGVSTCHYHADTQAWNLFCQLSQLSKRHAEAITITIEREELHLKRLCPAGKTLRGGCGSLFTTDVLAVLPAPNISMQPGFARMRGTCWLRMANPAGATACMTT